MRRKNIYIALISLLLLLAAVAAYVYFDCRSAWVSRSGKPHYYLFREGMGVDSLNVWLERDYTPRHHWRWRYCLQELDTVRPGYYRVDATADGRQVVRMLRLGQQTDYRLTIGTNLRTLEHVAGRIGGVMQVDSAAVMAAILQHVDSTEWLPETAICIFLPNTYFVRWTDSADRIVARMEQEYRRYWNDRRRHLADSLGLSLTEVMTLASIVNSETRRAEEWPMIASLYTNRLRKGMLLQADPTAVYATRDFGCRRVLRRHTHCPDRYNTYVHRGLPPGPIRCVRPECIDSVLAQPRTNYLYMCANPDWSGTHIFTSKYSDHTKVARAFQRELNRRHIRR